MGLLNTRQLSELAAISTCLDPVERLGLTPFEFFLTTCVLQSDPRLLEQKVRPSNTARMASARSLYRQNLKVKPLAPTPTLAQVFESCQEDNPRERQPNG